VEKNLRTALEQEDYDFAPMLAKAMKKRSYHLSQELDFPTRITVNNDSHPIYTLVEITSPDRLGLLHHLLHGLASVGVNIVLSRIATEKGAAIDSFYVTDMEGRKIKADEQIRRIHRVLNRAAQSATAG
jgi:[protein-PII] uridylyltransferase